ncbi:hypothetical protein AFM11_34190 [Mycolicibacterium wolinskyi]|uniref:AAA family ATPase n=1 Tax=Mycolicibacterium wolinskyi TaxID=59750 RepID=A0A132PBK5_9MYCO|nr:AAA family ATPase [Mycolicibacterium wolinskyi]KWX19698.1 hypothetical protein AFM11_34190 [Mycolicibacterium wolinskyi]
MATNADVVQAPWAIAGNLDAQVHETHTGVVILLGDKAYKAKKPVATDFLDFTAPTQREEACRREVALNSRLAPDSYLGVAHLVGPGCGEPEPLVVMRRYPEAIRLSTMVVKGQPVEDRLETIAETLADFHRVAERSQTIDQHGTAEAVAARWNDNLVELERYPYITSESVAEIRRLAEKYIAGRAALFAARIAGRRVVDGHADLLSDDIFCPPNGLAILDCLEFDDSLRYVDAIDDAAFLTMDFEFLGRADLGALFLDRYKAHARDDAPESLTDFYIAYRAVVRAKVDCVRAEQGCVEAADSARRHADIALTHLRAGTVQLIIVGGGPGTGKTTVSNALAQQVRAEVISTDDVRRQLQQAHIIEGQAGVLDSGLYTPEKVAAVYDEVLRRAREKLIHGVSVILDGTWRDPHQRQRARRLAAGTATPIVEFTCAVPLERASARIQSRSSTTSDATPEIAAALAEPDGHLPGGHTIDTSRPLSDSVAEAQRICCLAI